MLKILAILAFLFSLILILAFKPSSSGEIEVKVEIIGHVRFDGFLLKIDVKNLSKSKMTVLNDRRWDYKWERIRSLGNYIVEIEKSEVNKFQLFPPSADIDFFPSPGEYIKVAGLSTIRDSLYIDGHSFSRFGTGRKGFPQGSCRLRVSFNAGEWSNSQENTSEWIMFEIE